MGTQNRIQLLTGLFFNCNSPLHISVNEMEEKLKKVPTAFKEIQKAPSPLIKDGDNVMTGWMELPSRYLDEQAFFIQEIQDAAIQFAENIDAFVSAGIGGSYLGLEAVTDALLPPLYNLLSRVKRKCPQIFFAGNHLSCEELSALLEYLEDKKVGVNVISKSGTTTETAVAFRLLRHLLKKQNADETLSVIATTNNKKGALNDIALKIGLNKKYFSDKALELFTIPDNIGGRYSVLSPVGLFGMAVAGIDITALLQGAMDMQNKINRCSPDNPAFVRTALRILAAEKGAKIENMVTGSKRLYGLTRWARQLFPESEGKDGKGLWVSHGFYTEDAHSIGQLISGGERNIIETFITEKKSDSDLIIPTECQCNDGLEHLNSHQTVSFMNQCAIQGLKYDHFQRGVPIMEYEFPETNAYTIGQYLQCEMNVCLLVCYMQGINGVIQPDVEGYKQAMFALSGKKGYEKQKTEIESFFKRLKH